ncbi:MAG: VWA domain-containing protein [Saprospiraceae bacterium]|nr:VWA domain-containing protein [Saprospiraceae bacterium]
MILNEEEQTNNSDSRKGSADILLRGFRSMLEHYKENGFVFINYWGNSSELPIWKCILKSDQAFIDGIDLQTIHIEVNHLNKQLAQELAKRDHFNDPFWDSFMSKIRWTGCFVPYSEFQVNTKSQLKQEMDHFTLLIQYFDVKGYFLNLKIDSINDQYKTTPIAWLGIWNYLITYSKFIESCKDYSDAVPLIISHWHGRLYPIHTFKKCLPFQQLTILLLIAIESKSKFPAPNHRFKYYVKYSHPKVQSFIKKHNSIIQKWVQGEENTIWTDEMKSEFLEFGKIDKIIFDSTLFIQYLKETQFSTLPHVFEKIMRFGSTSQHESIADRIRNFSIVDYINNLPNLLQKRPERYNYGHRDVLEESLNLSWQNVSEQEIKEIQKIIVQMPDKERAKFDKYAKQPWKSHLIQMANETTLPIFEWYIHKSKIVVKVNTMEDKRAKKIEAEYNTKSEKITRQTKTYNQQTELLRNTLSRKDINKLKVSSPDFEDPILTKKWNLEVENQTSFVRHKNSYRQRRMLELGILAKDQYSNFKNEIWLNEMLEIEKEIRMYVPFVKKAFKTALPVKKSIEFNDYRHSTSGIEFDPTTINDQNKWLRGEVMKSLTSKIKLGEIEQINAFCLDFSGSMNHKRMRNLYKVLYLLVLGLEGRKSFDAFHFFNSYFIEGSDFSEKYTNRTSLFKILSKISIIDSGKVRYGGELGTNISGGIDECHQRIQAFKEKIKLKNPNSKFVCSMFVITDGEPSMGIVDHSKLKEYIQQKRKEGDIPIKGIYIKAKEDENQFMEEIFGKNEFVETVEFSEAVHKFVAIMTQTFKDQRNEEKWKQKKQTIQGKTQQ